MGETPLENSLREETERALEAIRTKEADEIKQMEQALVAEMQAFQTHIENATQARIEQALSRLENRATLELRKFKLTQIEEFVASIVDDAMRQIRSTPQYIPFLVDVVCEALRSMPAGATVHLAKEDLGLEPQIRAALESARLDLEIGFKEDPTIAFGGCLVCDEKGGRIFNATIERIYYRKQAQIRREAVRILEKAGE